MRSENPSIIHQMTHRFPIKEIALQAGLSTATVDRVLNNRAHVAPQTKRRVADAVHELEGQEAQLSARGRKLFVDILMEAPVRFSTKLRHATQSAITDFMPAVIRPRFHFTEIKSTTRIVADIEKIAKRGSDGLCLKARDVPEIRAAVDQLAQKGIPVVAIFTDLTDCKRIGYAGVNNQQAGRIAAYLISRALYSQEGEVLLSTSQDQFEGEAQRKLGFLNEIGSLCPNLRPIAITGGAGLDRESEVHIARALAQSNQLRAVYSMGGGNRAILRVLKGRGCRPEIFIAHDLDGDNRALLGRGEVQFVLEHDLRADMHAAFAMIARFHKLLPRTLELKHSEVQILTPYSSRD